jgi:hypothetical protein
MPMKPKPARTIGGITGKAQSNVSKVYQQMEQMPYKPGKNPGKVEKMPYTPPKDGSGPGIKTMPFKPESPNKKPADLKAALGPVKKTSRPGSADKQMIKQGGPAAEKQMIKQGGKVTITGSATGSKSLTAAQVAKMNKMTSKTKMGNR